MMPSVNFQRSGRKRVTMKPMTRISMESLIASVGFQLRQGKNIVSLGKEF